MSWTRPRAGWEDQTFSSKDVFAAANKRIRPSDELDEGERPVLESGGLFDVANQIYIKIHEKRKKTEMDNSTAQAESDVFDFKNLAVSEDKLEKVEIRESNILGRLVSPAKPAQKIHNLLFEGYSSSDSEPPKKRPPPAKKLLRK